MFDGVKHKTSLLNENSVLDAVFTFLHMGALLTSLM